MPTSKQARSRQARQKERLAAAAVQKQTSRRRRRHVFAGIAVFVVIVLVAGVFIFSSTTHNDRVDISAPSTNAPTNVPTSAPLASVAGKPCVAQKGKLPKGAPEVDVAVGPAPTELVVKDLKEGTGAVIKASDTVTGNYIGVACSTGKIFDSSWQRGQPATFPLEQVIAGWQEGIPGMKVGGRRLLGIPSDQAYGPQGQGDIAPDEALWFVVDITEATPTTVPSTPTS